MDTTQLTFIQRAALARAVALTVSCLNEESQEKFIETYDALVDAAESQSSIPKNITIWGALSGCSLNDVLEFIEKEYEANMSMISDILNRTKDGLVDAAINDELSLNANDWCLNEYAERGYALDDN